MLSEKDIDEIRTGIEYDRHSGIHNKCIEDILNGNNCMGLEEVIIKEKISGWVDDNCIHNGIEIIRGVNDKWNSLVHIITDSENLYDVDNAVRDALILVNEEVVQKDNIEVIIDQIANIKSKAYNNDINSRVYLRAMYINMSIYRDKMEATGILIESIEKIYGIVAELFGVLDTALTNSVVSNSPKEYIVKRLIAAASERDILKDKLIARIISINKKFKHRLRELNKLEYNRKPGKETKDNRKGKLIEEREILLDKLEAASCKLIYSINDKCDTVKMQLEIKFNSVFNINNIESIVTDNKDDIYSLLKTSSKLVNKKYYSIPYECIQVEKVFINRQGMVIGQVKLGRNQLHG